MVGRLNEFKALEKKYYELLQSCQPKPPLSEEDIYANTDQVTPVDAGHAIVENVIKKLDTLSRSELQVQMHRVFLKCCANVIFGGDVVANYQLEIMEKWKWPDLKQEQIITAPRRFGKSWAVAMFACALALSKPNVEISIFSTGSRAAGADGGLMSIIKRLIKGHFGIGREFIVLDNQERLFLKFGDNDIRKINAFPGSVHTYVLYVFLQQSSRGKLQPQLPSSLSCE